MTTQIKYNVGDIAPLNQKASNSSDALCFACGRKLGKNPLYFEVTTSWELLAVGNKSDNSQGCFPIGRECAKAFAPNLLVNLGGN